MFILIFTSILIILFFVLHGIFSSKIEEYEKIIDDLIHYMSIKDYNSFVDWANYTKNGKSRYKWYNFYHFGQKRIYKNEKDLKYKKKES